MEKSRRTSTAWASHGGRREDHKRTRDEFDHVAHNIVAKMKRELSGRLIDDADRLRRERNKVDAENDKLHGENDKLHAENDKLHGKNDKLHAENDRLRAENDKLHAENDRLRAESDKLRAESDRKSAALSQLEQQLTKRFKTALEDAFDDVLGAPLMSEGTATDPSEEDGAAPTLPEETPANTAETGPGEAAPEPEEEEEEEEEEAKLQDEALEQAVHSRREMPAALGGQ